MPLHSELFNVVVLPATAPAAASDLAPRLYQLSATRNDRALRLVSPLWPETQVRAALHGIGTSGMHVEQLLRGNRMAHGGRDHRKLFFTQPQLLQIGLAPAPEPPAPETPLS